MKSGTEFFSVFQQLAIFRWLFCHWKFCKTVKSGLLYWDQHSSKEMPVFLWIKNIYDDHDDDDDDDDDDVKLFLWYEWLTKGI